MSKGNPSSLHNDRINAHHHTLIILGEQSDQDLHYFYCICMLLMKFSSVEKFRNSTVFEPRCEKNGFQGFGPGLIQTELYNQRR